jgi:hypothetical protein
MFLGDDSDMHVRKHFFERVPRPESIGNKLVIQECKPVARDSARLHDSKLVFNSKIYK